MATLAEELFAQACAHEAAGNRAAATLLNNAHAEIERLTDALAASPVREEKAGACWCGKARASAAYWHVEGDDPTCDYPEDWFIDSGVYCWKCGASLGADGIARRWVQKEVEA